MNRKSDGDWALPNPEVTAGSRSLQVEKPLGRSVAAVAAGLGVWIAITAAKFAAITACCPGILPARGTSEFPHAGSLALVVATDLLAMMLAGYVAAHVSRRARLGHAVMLGGLMAGVGLAAMGAGWDLVPLWYQVALVSIAVPAAVTGGAWRSDTADR